MSNRLKKIILVIGDILVLYCTLYLTLLVRYAQIPGLKLWMDHFFPFSIIIVVWIIIFYISELYNLSYAISNWHFFRLSLRSFIAGGVISSLFFYLVPGIKIAPKTNLLLFTIILTFLFFLWRHFFNWSLKSYLPKDILGIIGYNTQVENLITELTQKPHLGFNISFIIIHTREEKDSLKKLKNNIPIYYDVNELKNLIIKYKTSTLILASDPVKSKHLSSILFDCLPLKLNYINLSRFYENITGKIPIDIINKVWFIENLSEGNKNIYDLTKQIFEMMLSSITLLVIFPFWIIIGLIIKLESKGSIFFKQLRIGQNDSQFVMIKFRTMHKKGNDYSPTEKDDSRITSFGSFLRKTRIDELPQIINVLKGEMSFVGPRPERPELVTELEKKIPFYNERMLVKPGITGWDQISSEYHSPSFEDSIKKLQYDLFYIKNRSVYLDISIILKTISTVLTRSGR